MKAVCIKDRGLFQFKKGKTYNCEFVNETKEQIDSDKKITLNFYGYRVFYNNEYAKILFPFGIFFPMNNFDLHFKSTNLIRKEKLTKLNESSF